MTSTRLNEFVDAFLTIWNTQGLPQGCSVNVRGISLEEAYVVQRGVIACRMADGERVVGYKVGCTSTAIRQQFGLSEPIYGRLMAPHIHHGQTELALSLIHISEPTRQLMSSRMPSSA